MDIPDLLRHTQRGVRCVLPSVAEKAKLDDLEKTRDVKDMNGYEFEEYVARRLVAVGYSNVDVTPKSGDYDADILARSNGRKVCIQCKKYSKPVGIEAVQEVLGAKAYYSCDVGVVVSTAGFTDAAVSLASAAGIVLVSADRIKKV